MQTDDDSYHKWWHTVVPYISCLWYRQYWPCVYLVSDWYQILRYRTALINRKYLKCLCTFKTKETYHRELAVWWNYFRFNRKGPCEGQTEDFIVISISVLCVCVCVFKVDTLGSRFTNIHIARAQSTVCIHKENTLARLRGGNSVLRLTLSFFLKVQNYQRLWHPIYW